MEQTLSIEQYLASAVQQKVKEQIGTLTTQLFDAQAKAELLQELYNNSQKQLEELKGQLDPAKVTEQKIEAQPKNKKQA